MNSRSQPTLTTELALLGFLRSGPRHGYEIFQLMTDPAGLGGVWRIKLGRLYAMLGRLEARGYVAARIEPQEDRPPRKIFRLTPTGEHAFLGWVESPVAQPRDLRLEFMLKLHFAQQEPPAVAARLVARQRQHCAAWLDSPLVAEQGASPQLEAVRRFRRGQIEAIDAWLAWLSATLEAGS